MAIGNAIGIGIPTVNLGLGGGSEPVEERFVIQVQTDNAGSSADNQYTLNWTGTYDVDWGDNVIETGLVNQQTHTYASAGTYNIKVTAVSGYWEVNGSDRDKTIDILNWGTYAWTSMRSMMARWRGNQNISATDIPNLTLCTDMESMFNGANFETVNLIGWDVSNVTSMGFMFRNAANFTSYDPIVDVSGWDVSNCTNIRYMFSSFGKFGSTGNDGYIGDVSNWNTGNVTLMDAFSGSDQIAGPNFTLANWDITSVTSSIGIGTPQTIENYNASLINFASQSPPLNLNCSFGNNQYSYEAAAARQTLIDTYGWTITDGGQTVSPEFVIQVQTDNIGTSNDDQFTLPWTGTYDVDWGDGNVETGVVDTQTHAYASAGTYDIKVTAATGRILFNDGGDDGKVLEIKNWGTCEWTSMENAFYGCSNLDFGNSIDSPNLSNCTSLNRIFYKCTSLTTINNGLLDLSSWDVSNITSFGRIIDWSTPANSVDLSGWVINSSAGFVGYGFAFDVNSCDFSNWDVSQKTDLVRLFQNSTVGNAIGLDTWDVSNVTNYQYTFNRPLSSFSISDIVNWNFVDGASFQGAFQSSNNITDLSVLNSISLKPSNVSSMFAYGISSDGTNNLNLNNWDMSLCTNAYAMFSGNNSQFQQDIFSQWDITNISNFSNFMLGSEGLTQANYNSTLIGWEQTLQNTYPNGVGYPYNIAIDFGNSQYSLGGAAETARNTLINTYGWTITDGGGIFVGLLDTYTGAAAAYSLRDLASASVGNAVVRVRRSSDNAEQDFTAAEITDGTLTTFTGANDGFVTTWYDQSGNNKHATQATALYQRILVTNGVLNTFNGKPCDDYVAGSRAYNVPNDAYSAPFTYFMVAKPNATQSDVYQGSGNNGTSILSTNITRFYGGNFVDVVHNLGLDQIVTYALFNGVSSEFQVNDITPITTGDIGTSTNVAANKFGFAGYHNNSGQVFTGKFQEMIIYTSDKSTYREGVIANINNEYTIY